MKNKKVVIGILSCMILTGGFLGYNNTKVLGEEKPPEVTQLTPTGSIPEEAIKPIPNIVKDKIKIPKKLPFNVDEVNNTAKSTQFGEGIYYYEEYWEKDGKFFFFNVINATPSIDEAFIKDSKFSYQTVEIYNGILATYLAGPTSEKIFWNDNGYQYMIGANSKNGKVDFYGANKLVETVLSLK